MASQKTSHTLESLTRCEGRLFAMEQGEGDAPLGGPNSRSSVLQEDHPDWLPVGLRACPMRHGNARAKKKTVLGKGKLNPSGFLGHMGASRVSIAGTLYR